MTKPDIYAFSAAVTDCRAYVRLNGLPLVELEPAPDRWTKSEAVSIWIRPGMNVLEVSLALRPESDPGASEFQASVVSTAREPNATAKSLVEVRWPPPTSGDLVPYYGEHQFDGSTPSVLWDMAEPQEPSPVVDAELRAFAQTVHTVFDGGDPDVFASLVDFKGRDIGRVLGLGEEGGIRSQRDFLEAIMSGPDTGVEPLDSDALRVRPMSEFRIFRLRRGNRPLLLTANRQGMDVYVSKLNGQWNIVR